MVRVAALLLAISLVGGSLVGAVTTVSASESRVHQDIFTTDCTSTTTNTGASTTTAYGCPEPPTIESFLRIMAGQRVVFEGWFDVLNMQDLKITFLGAYTYEYQYMQDSELTLSGDRWELQIGELRPGTYTMTVRMLATNSATVATSREVIVQEDHSIVAPGIMQDVTGAGAAVQTSQGSKRQPGDGGAAPSDDISSGAEGGNGPTITDGGPAFVEQLRRIITSYVSPTLIIAFISSLIVCGYLFYLLGRHYRRLDEQRRQKAKALKRAMSGNRKPRRRTALRHAVQKQRRSHP